MAEESDLAKKFSTLNVNAMEFVPSFCTGPTAASPGGDSTPVAPEPSQNSSEATTPVEAQTPVDQSPTKTDNEPQPVTVAASSEPISDKSPGECSNLVFLNFFFFSCKMCSMHICEWTTC